MHVKILKADKSDIKKIVFEMNKIFIHTKKNKKFILWQYFNNIYYSKLFKIITNNSLIGIGGFQRKILQTKEKAFQYIGLFIIEEFRGKGMMKKLLSFIKKKIFSNFFFFVIGNKNLNFASKKIFNKINLKKINNYQINKNKIQRVIFKNDFNLNQTNNLFYKTKKHFEWRYILHPLYKYIIIDGKLFTLVFKIYKKNSKKQLDLTDCKIKKKINFNKLMQYIFDQISDLSFNVFNIWTFENSIFDKNLKNSLFKKEKIFNKFFIYKRLKKIDLNKKLIFSGDADY